MGWFDEQIRARMKNDQDVLEDSFIRMAGAVIDHWRSDHLHDGRMNAEDALSDIMKYYHRAGAEIAEDSGLTDQLETALSSCGLMVREAELEKGWHRGAYGAMIGFIRETSQIVALIPRGLSGYSYRDPATGKRKKITRKNADIFSAKALCIYEPLPMKSLGVSDLLLYMKRCISKLDIVMVLIAALAMTLIGMIEPRVYQLITGDVLKNKRIHLLVGMSIFLVCSAFSAQLIGLVRTMLVERINTKTSQSVEASVMMRILTMPVRFFRKYSSGELSDRVKAINSLCKIILDNIFSIGLTSLMSLLYITQIFKFAPSLVWPSTVVILTTVIISIAASWIQIGVTRKSMELSAKVSGMSYSLINGVTKIRLAGAEKRMFARWGRLYAKQAKTEYDPPFFLKINSVLVTAVSLVGTIVLYYVAVGSGVSESEYYAFNAAYGRVAGAFSALAGIAVSVAAVKPVLDMAEPILAASPETGEDKEAVAKLKGNIELSHVTFRYDEGMPDVVKDLNLKINAGEYVAIVGKTGCGKSTLVRLMLGFEKPQIGSVYYDRYDLSRVDPHSVRKQIGVVLQNSQLIRGDIYSNIVISAPQLTLDDAWEAAEIAGIAGDIREMPMGMSTYVSEGQGGISGGQKQRLMIARAIAPKPGILIFDEATSALDNRTQKQVSDALEGMGCTRVVIAHRLSTIRHCDRILVMDEGAIVEEGGYEELIQRNGYFAELVARQRV